MSLSIDNVQSGDAIRADEWNKLVNFTKRFSVSGDLADELTPPYENKLRIHGKLEVVGDSLSLGFEGVTMTGTALKGRAITEKLAINPDNSFNGGVEVESDLTVRNNLLIANELPIRIEKAKVLISSSGNKRVEIQGVNPHIWTVGMIAGYRFDRDTSSSKRIVLKDLYLAKIAMPDPPILGQIGRPTWQINANCYFNAEESEIALLLDIIFFKRGIAPVLIDNTHHQNSLPELQRGTVITPGGGQTLPTDNPLPPSGGNTGGGDIIIS